MLTFVLRPSPRPTAVHELPRALQDQIRYGRQAGLEPLYLAELFDLQLELVLAVLNTEPLQTPDESIQ